jgi:hypothetical protein
MSSSTNCEVTVSDVVSMIVNVPPHDSRTTVSTPGRPGCHIVPEAIAFAINMRNATVSTIARHS